MNLGDLPAQLFSPAKMIYIGYIVTAIFRELPKTQWAFLIEFFLVSLAFFAAHIAHDDHWRIRWNIRAWKREGIPDEVIHRLLGAK